MTKLRKWWRFTVACSCNDNDSKFVQCTCTFLDCLSAGMWTLKSWSPTFDSASPPPQKKKKLDLRHWQAQRERREETEERKAYYSQLEWDNVQWQVPRRTQQQPVMSLSPAPVTTRQLSHIILINRNAHRSKNAGNAPPPTHWRMLKRDKSDFLLSNTEILACKQRQWRMKAGTLQKRGLPHLEATSKFSQRKSSSKSLLEETYGNVTGGVN